VSNSSKDGAPSRMGWRINMEERMKLCRGRGPLGGPPFMRQLGETHPLEGYGTEELRSLFEEWLALLEREVLAFAGSHDPASPEAVAEEFSLSTASASFILSKLEVDQDDRAAGSPVHTGGAH